jgi:hypothetical protein
VAWKLTEAFVQLGAPLGNLNSDLKKAEKSVFKSVKKMADVARNIGLKLSIGGAAITGVSGLLAKFAMTAEETENLFEVSMGKMADQARAWSSSLSDSLGLNRIEVQKMMGVFNVMFKSMGEGAGGAFKMSKQLTQLAFDMSSFFNLRPEVAFEKLQAGITGEIEPLKRLGILLNQSTLETKALTMGITEQWSEVDELTKVHIRLAAIMDQTKAAQGDLARTSDSATNQLRSFRSLVDEIAITLGKALLPSLKILLTRAREIAKAFLEWSKENQSLLERIIPLTAALGALALALGPVLIALPTLLTILSGIKLAILAITSPLTLVVAGLAAIGALVIPWETVKKTLEGFFQPSKDTANALGDMATAAGNAETSIKNINPLITNMGAVGQIEIGKVDTAATALGETFVDIGIRTGKYARNAQDAGAKAARSFWTVKPAGDAMRDVFDQAGKTVITTGQNMVTAGAQGEEAGFKVRDGFNEGAKAVEEMDRLIDEEATKAINELKSGMEEYSGVTKESAAASISWADEHREALDRIKSATAQMVEALKPILAKFGTRAREVFRGMFKDAKFHFGQIIDFVGQDWLAKWRNLWDSIFSIVSDAITRITTAWQNLLSLAQRVNLSRTGRGRSTQAEETVSGQAHSGLGASSTTNMGGVTINIAQQEGENSEMFARKVAEAINFASRGGLLNTNAALP